MDISNILHQWPLQAVAALVAGILVLLVPRILNYAIAAYLILVGVIGLLDLFDARTLQPQSVIALVAGILILIKPNILNYVVGVYLILIGLLEAGVIRL